MTIRIPKAPPLDTAITPYNSHNSRATIYKTLIPFISSYNFWFEP